MTRIEKALLEYPDGIVYKLEKRAIRIIDCCPYFLLSETGDEIIDDLDEYSKVGDYGNIRGCRGITCEECWNKETSDE